MNAYRKFSVSHWAVTTASAAFLLTLSGGQAAYAGVALDAFNSANTALAPSGGMDNDTLQRRSRRGPADALVEFTHRQRMQQAREEAQAAASRPAGPPVAAVDAAPPAVGTR